MKEITPIDEINQIHVAIEASCKDILEKMIRAGELLTIERAKFGPRDGWMKWQKDNLDFVHQTVWRYMRAYECREELREMFILRPGSNIKKALNIIGDKEPLTPEQQAKKDARAARKAEKELKEEEKQGITDEALANRVDQVWEKCSKDYNEKAKRIIAKILIRRLYYLYPEFKDQIVF
jgi:hypothetical protein